MILQWLPVALLRLIIFLSRPLPYRARVAIIKTVILILASLLPLSRRRIDANIAAVGFDISPETPASFRGKVIANFATSLGELFNIEDFSAQSDKFHLSGDGLALFEQLLAEKKAAIIVSGHLGQWEAIRAWAAARDRPLGVLYKENANPYYEALMRKIYNSNGPAYLTGVRGTAGFVRQLKAGEMVALLHDQRIYDADEFPFMGVPARTSTATAALALKYDVPIIPIYAIRRENGYDYDIIVEPEIARGDVDTMTQAINDNLEKFVRLYPTQWYWFHQRWKKKGDK